MKYIKEFFLRGLMFGGFGPIVLGIVYFILSKNLAEFSLSGNEVCLGIISVYILAFLQAGATVFNQIEHWSVPKSLLCHFATLYLAYTICYLINTWIPFKAEILLIFTAIFVIVYFAIWITVYLSVKKSAEKFNKNLG